MTAPTVGPGLSTDYLDALIGVYVQVYRGPDSYRGGWLVSYDDVGIVLREQTYSMRLAPGQKFTPDKPTEKPYPWAAITTIRKDER